MTLFQRIQNLFWRQKKQKSSPKLFLKIPKNLEEALVRLDEHLSDKDKQYIRDNLDKDPYIHMRFGMEMRNSWGLWQKGTPLHDWFEMHGVFHADDMSGIINKSFVRRLKGEPIQFEEQVARTKRYWAKMDEAQKKGTTGFTMVKVGDEWEIEPYDSNQVDKI